MTRFNFQTQEGCYSISSLDNYLMPASFVECVHFMGSDHVCALGDVCKQERREQVHWDLIPRRVFIRPRQCQRKLIPRNGLQSCRIPFREIIIVPIWFRNTRRLPSRLSRRRSFLRCRGVIVTLRLSTKMCGFFWRPLHIPEVKKRDVHEKKLPKLWYRLSSRFNHVDLEFCIGLFIRCDASCVESARSTLFITCVRLSCLVSDLGVVFDQKLWHALISSISFGCFKMPGSQKGTPSIVCDLELTVFIVKTRVYIRILSRLLRFAGIDGKCLVGIVV